MVVFYLWILFQVPEDVIQYGAVGVGKLGTTLVEGSLGDLPYLEYTQGNTGTGQ